MNKEKQVKVKWRDAVSYYNLEEMPDNTILQETEGELIKEGNNYIILKNPQTKDYNPHSHRGINQNNKDKKPSFLFIPKGMIKEMDH